MKLLQELFRAPSEIGDGPEDAKSNVAFDIKVAFTHDPELANLMKDRFSSDEFIKEFEKNIYQAIVGAYRQLQSDASVYSGNDWIDDLTIEAKMRKFSTGAFESIEDERNVMLTLADVYNKSIEMIHTIAESDGVDIETIEKQIEAARRGLGLVNKLKPGPDRVKHAKRVMTNLNKLRSKLKKAKAQAKASESKPVIAESFTQTKLLNNVSYDVSVGKFVFEAKRKNTLMGDNNPVAKNAKINKGGTHPDKKNDYTRKTKHKKSPEKE